MHCFERIILLPVFVPLVLMCWVPNVVGEEAIKSNLDVLSNLAAEVVEDLITDFQPHMNASEKIILAPFAKDEIYDFLTNIFTSELSSRNFKIFHSEIKTPSRPKGQAKSDVSATPANDGFQGEANGVMKIEFQALEFSLTYPKIFRSHLIGGRKVKRRAEIKLFAKLLDTSDQSVTCVGEASRDYQDQFPYGARAQTEESLFSFTKPPVEPTHWGRIVEPVVVSGIIVGLVYLFFSNQSEN